MSDAATASPATIKVQIWMALPPLSVLPVGGGTSVAACATVIVTVGVGVGAPLTRRSVRTARPEPKRSNRISERLRLLTRCKR